MKIPSVSSIGIVGGGVVGSATAAAFSDCRVFKWDIKPDRSTSPLKDVFKADLIFICLPTPMYFDGSCDLSSVIGFVTQLSSDEKKLPFVLRSTVPVGFTKSLKDLYGLENVVHSPEFLTARTANVDVMNPRAMYIGVPDYDHESDTEYPTAEKVYSLYDHRFPWLDSDDIIITGSSETELMKLATNSFFAVKVSFFNELKAFADKKGLDWDRVIAGILADKRIHPMHTKVPGPDGQLGFGGTCLPKDLSSLATQMWRAETPRNTLLAAQYTNKEVRKGGGQ